MDGPAEALRELVRVPAGRVGVVADAEPDVETVGFVVELAQQVPQSERVLTARHRDEHALSRFDHVEVGDGPPHLLTAVMQEAVAAERGIVAAHVDHRRFPTPAALHEAPPDTTGRISTTSASASRSSRVTSVSLRITRTDSGTTSSWRSNCSTL